MKKKQVKCLESQKWTKWSSTWSSILAYNNYDATIIKRKKLQFALGVINNSSKEKSDPTTWPGKDVKTLSKTIPPREALERTLPWGQRGDAQRSRWRWHKYCYHVCIVVAHLRSWWDISKAAGRVMLSVCLSVWGCCVITISGGLCCSSRAEERGRTALLGGKYEVKVEDMPHADYQYTQ